MPREGPAILASNHLSFADHFFGPLPLPRKVTFLAKAEYFTGRGLKGLGQQGVLPRGRADPGGPGRRRGQRAGAGDRPARAGRRAAASASTRRAPGAPTGGCYRGRPGWPGSPWSPGAPVIPTAMVGTFEFMPPGRLIWPRLRIRPGVRFGKPLDFSRYSGLESDRTWSLRAVTDEIMRRADGAVGPGVRGQSTRSGPSTGCGETRRSHRSPGRRDRRRRRPAARSQAPGRSCGSRWDLRARGRDDRRALGTRAAPTVSGGLQP